MSTHHHVAVIGTGFSGLGMAIQLKRAGYTDFVVLERAAELGGTWRDNTYPGCACDVPSNLYSFSFAPNPDWTQAYAQQPEILAYLRRVAREHGVLPHVRFGHNLERADWDEARGCWQLTTSAGPLSATFLISGHGPLAEPRLPPVPGLADFEGAVFHSARWNHAVDLSGKRVAVVGTGASAVQFIPAIQPKVAQLHVFQRSAPWVVPRRNRPFSARERLVFRRLPLVQRLARARIYAQLEANVLGFRYPKMEALVEKLARAHLAAQVPDPALRAALTPSYRIGCKRIMVSDDFYPALTRPNVELIPGPLLEVRARSVVSALGEREVDAIILGTGFDTARTPAAHIFRGQDGRTLWEAWGGSPEAYLGVTVSGFPNLFLLVGPNTGLGHNSIIYMIEAQIRYILGALKYAASRQLRALEVKPEAQASFNTHLQAELRRYVWSQGSCTSFYLDAEGKNIGLWPGFTFRYRRRTRRFDPRAYALR